MATSTIKGERYETAEITSFTNASGCVRCVRKGSVVTLSIDLTMSSGTVTFNVPTWAIPAQNLYEKWWEAGGGNLYLYAYITETTFTMTHSVNGSTAKVLTYIAK